MSGMSWRSDIDGAIHPAASMATALRVVAAATMAASVRVAAAASMAASVRVRSTGEGGAS